jgi:hypothetical protein
MRLPRFLSPALTGHSCVAPPSRLVSRSARPFTVSLAEANYLGGLKRVFEGMRETGTPELPQLDAVSPRLSGMGIACDPNAEFASTRRNIPECEAAMFGLFKKKDTTRMEVVAIRPRILERFPADITVLLSDEALSHAAFARHAAEPWAREDVELWENILALWPTPPSGDDDRNERESRFWEMYADKATLKSNGERVALAAKPDIVNYFQTYEKWIFREYYAATGTLHNSSVNDWYRIIAAWHNADYYSNFAVHEKKQYALRVAETELEKFQAEVKPAHYEKWGAWFFLNIEEAFRKKHASPLVA